MIYKIEYIQGSIFNSIHADYKVCPVNKVGVMGAGLAKEFKKRMPQCELLYLRYLSFLKEFGFLIGKEEGVIHLATKDHWKQDSDINFIRNNLKNLVETLNYSSKEKTIIAFPKIGCGCGKLQWIQMQPMMEEELNKLNDNFIIEIYL